MPIPAIIGLAEKPNIEYKPTIMITIKRIKFYILEEKPLGHSTLE